MSVPGHFVLPLSPSGFRFYRGDNYLDPEGTPHDHYVYFRAFSRGTRAPEGATLALFLAPFAAFQTPALWTEVGSHAIVSSWDNVGGVWRWHPNTADECVTLDAGVIAGLGIGHFCFIAILNSALDPAPDRNTIDSLDSYYRFIAGSNNYAWRNCDIVEAAPVGDSRYFLPIKRKFLISRFKRHPGPRDLELDLDELPRGTELLLWTPRKRIPRIRVEGLRREASYELRNPDAQFLARDVLRAQRQKIPMDKITRMVPPRDLRPEGISADQLRWLSPIAVPVINYRRVSISGLTPGNDSLESDYTVYLVLKLPDGTPKQSVRLSITEKFGVHSLGQMNFILNIQ